MLSALESKYFITCSICAVLMQLSQTTGGIDRLRSPKDASTIFGLQQDGYTINPPVKAVLSG